MRDKWSLLVRELENASASEWRERARQATRKNVDERARADAAPPAEPPDEPPPDEPSPPEPAPTEP